MTMELKRRPKSHAAQDSFMSSAAESCLPLTSSSHDDPSAQLLQQQSSFWTLKRQVAVRRVFFVLVLLACGAMIVKLFLVALSDAEPRFYTIGSTSEYNHNTKQALREWKHLYRHEGKPFIHLLHSRFMQQQGNLTFLAQARLLLFEVFCLPTIVHQTSQHFLWIIKTDPNLNNVILRQLIDLLEPYDNFYLVASNINFLVNQNFTGAWRTSEIRELQINQRHIYTGNRQRLVLAMALAKELPVLETRLDADDGLNVGYIQYIQEHALREFENKPNLLYKYWCSRRSLEWHWQIQNQQQQQHQQQQYDTDGTLQAVIHSKLCITPGITVGFPVGVKESQVPVVQHNLLRQSLVENTTGLPCGATDPQDCLSFVEGFTFDAIRSRTPTSAGMLEVLAMAGSNDAENSDRSGGNQPSEKMDSAALAAAIAMGAAEQQQLEQFSSWMQYAYWNFLYDSFRIARMQVRFVQRYMQRTNLYKVAKDNLAGQCTAMHSCKDAAKRDLEIILKLTKPSS